MKEGITMFAEYPSQHSEQLYDKGWEQKDIQQWLGHADIGTTGNIYTHLTRMRKENIGKDLEDVFRRYKAKPHHEGGARCYNIILLNSFG